MNVPLLKRQADSPIQRIEPPAEVRLALDGLTPVVAQGDAIEAHSLVAGSQNGSRPSPRLHSPLAGHVASIRNGEMTLNGRWIEAQPSIERDDFDTLTPQEITAIARDAGLLGMGGARFPTHLKLQNDRPLDYVIVNGCESEPFLCCDHRVLAEHHDEVESGMRLAMRAVGAKEGRIVRQKDGYLSGYDRFLIKEVLGREVPSGGVPQDVGVVVLNVQTVRALHQAVFDRKPLVDRVLTVDGTPLGRPGNFLVPLGTTVGYILDVCECDMDRTAAIILGGPMMGVQANFDTSITAGTGGVLALTRDQLVTIQDAPCIRCGLCFQVCPLGLPAGQLTRRPTREVHRCIECGICQFACPARRPLVSMMHAAKATLPADGHLKR